MLENLLFSIKKCKMILLLLIPVFLLLIDGLLAHWLVKRFVYLPASKYVNLWKFLIALLVFLVLGAITSYLFFTNFRFTR